MKTQLLIKYKPVRAIQLDDATTYSPVGDFGLREPMSRDNDWVYRQSDNPNYRLDKGFLTAVRRYNGLVNIDLYEDVEMPLNYTILDIREPDKRKTNFSKTIRIPGTKNNNRILNHIYEINANSKFNPNIRTEVVILQEGVQVIKGNMQLVNITRFNNNEVEYEILISGDFTSLFSDIGVAKLSDLDFSEYNHTWNRAAIQDSWNGLIRKKGGNINLSGGPGVSNVNTGILRAFTSIGRQASTGRVLITTSTSHGLTTEDWIRVIPDDDTNLIYKPLIRGDFAVSDIVSPTQFTINYPFPDGLFGNALTGNIQRWNPTGEGYVYPMISWGDDALVGGQLRFPTTAFAMSFYVKEILDKIFKKTNSRYESNFLNSKFFKRLILTQKKTNYDLPITELKGRSFKVANDSQPLLRVAGGGTEDSVSFNGQTRSFPFNNTYAQAYNFDANISTSEGFLFNGFAADKPYNPDTRRWVVTDNGKYSLSFNITFDGKVDMSNWRRPSGSPTFSNVAPPTTDTKYYWGIGRNDSTLKVIAKIMHRSGGVTTTLNEMIHQFDKSGNNKIIQDTYKNWRFEARSLSVGFTDRYLRKGDELWIEVSYNCGFNNTRDGIFTEIYTLPTFPNSQFTFYRRGIWDLRTLGIQVFENKPGGTITENSEIFPAQFLPKDMSCRDFLLGIIRMFNLHIESDKEIDKFYRIEPRDDYYAEGSAPIDFVDWHDKADLETVQSIPMGELTAKYYSFEYKQENDFWNKRYLDDTSKVYGNYIKEIQNDFLQNEQKISVPFGSTVMINNPETTAIVMPQVVQRDNNNSNKPTNSAGKILFWGGLRPTSRTNSIYSWDFVESTQTSTGIESTGVVKYTSYPYAGTCDSPLDPEIDLNWFYTDYVYWNRARWSNSNLYNVYWRRFIEEITDPDSKVIKIRMRLKPTDIYNLDFKKIYVIDGAWLRLQKIIDYNANSNDPTLCEFLKLKSPSRFKKQSVVVGTPFDPRVKDNSRQLSVADTEVPPRDFTNRKPISNFATNELSGISTITFNGENNVVSEGANNISIAGDENFIGSSTTNVSISGDGVFISGGLTNVNVIGTNKIFVDESDVTYINGIRYKNGVAISRANVIDGGLNKVSDRSAPNTTINVVDACEDITICFGSATWENVVNAGMDRILPNIPQYGVATLNSPNPTTNLTGAVWKPLDSTTTTVEDIQAKVNPIPYLAE